MAKLAKCNWGLVAGVTRSTSLALSVGLCKYGRTTVGSGALEGSMRMLGVRLMEIGARRITGVSKSAILAPLRAVAGTFAITNIFGQQCAFL